MDRLLPGDAAETAWNASYMSGTMIEEKWNEF
jgi:hypothetical protein